MNLRDFRYLKSVTRTGHRTPLLYGASKPDGPWFRLSKRETAWVTANADKLLSQNATLAQDEKSV